MLVRHSPKAFFSLISAFQSMSGPKRNQQHGQNSKGTITHYFKPVQQAIEVAVDIVIGPTTTSSNHQHRSNNRNGRNQSQHKSHNKKPNKGQTKHTSKSNVTSHSYSSPPRHTSKQSRNKQYSNNRKSPSISSSDDDYFAHHKPYPLPCKSSQRWQKIMTELTKPIKDSTDLIKILYRLAGDKQKNKLSCRGLSALLNKVMTVDEQRNFYQITLPFIKQCALNLPSLFHTKEICLLHEGNRATVEFTEHQVASLLAMSFFGLNTWERVNESRDWPRFNITNLFGYLESVYLEKLRCILHYFYILAMESKSKNKSSDRTISIYRHIPQNHEYQIFRNDQLSNNVTPLCPFEFKVSGSIEHCDNALQIDFANKYIGGGVLSSGCVQEEIRFLINPECLVSLLLCQCMKPNEAIAVVGTRQFANYKGYGSSFQFNGHYNDQTPIRTYDRYYKRRNCIVAIDAEKFYRNETWKQYSEKKMRRELIKCYTGFSIPTVDTNLDASKEMDGKLWIATGNWGCGVFGGDIELKCIIQWMGASLAQRKIQYFAFGDKGCKYMASFTQIVRSNNVTVGMLWRYLCDYAKYRENAYRNNPNQIASVFQYIVAQIRGKDKTIKLTAHPELRNKKNNDVQPKCGAKWKQEEKEQVQRKKADDDHINQAIPRQMSFDDNELDIPKDDSDSCGLISDDQDNEDKKKHLPQISEKQGSNAPDEDEDHDVDMILESE
eukprot:180888_1